MFALLLVRMTARRLALCTMTAHWATVPTKTLTTTERAIMTKTNEVIRLQDEMVQAFRRGESILPYVQKIGELLFGQNYNVNREVNHEKN